jgi:hypothetical protein
MTWDRRLYFPSEGSACYGFLSPIRIHHPRSHEIHPIYIKHKLFLQLHNADLFSNLQRLTTIKINNIIITAQMSNQMRLLNVLVWPVLCTLYLFSHNIWSRNMTYNNHLATRRVSHLETQAHLVWIYVKFDTITDVSVCVCTQVCACVCVCPAVYEQLKYITVQFLIPNHLHKINVIIIPPSMTSQKFPLNISACISCFLFANYIPSLSQIS